MLVRLPKFFKIYALLALFMGAGCQSLVSKASYDKDFHLSKNIYQQMEFIAHEEDTPFGSYLAMNLPFAPFADLKQQVEKEFNVKLKNRGEAHITVITPPEFKNELSLSLNINAISNFARQFNIQKVNFKPICVGQASLVVDGKKESVFYVVVDAPELHELRMRIKQMAPASEFNPELFFPHITLGFTKRDLHYEDGIKKDESTCVALVKIN